ncbi:MAG TPA: hypothetical protein VEP30_01100 [Chthoniobacterales bacterium]|nr:hypothetical protein [Chthoniobacterales bacterium]
MRNESGERTSTPARNGKLVGFVTALNVLVSIAIASTAAILNARVQREGITQVYADKIFAHLSDLQLEGSDHAGMVIDLFDMITEANINAKTYKDPKRQELIPLRMALLTGNDDILTNIGFATEKRKLWVGFARQSRNDKVRATALRALGKIGEYSQHESHIAELRFCIRNILDISEDFRRPATYDDARHSIDALTDLISKEPILLDDNELAGLFKEVAQQLASKHSELLRQAPTASTEVHPASNVLPLGEHTSNHPLYVAATNVEMFDRPLFAGANVKQQLQETDATLEKLGRLSLDGHADKPSSTLSGQSEAKTTEALKQLYSQKTEERQQARTSLVSQGPKSLKPLLNMLEAGGQEPRLRISLAYSLAHISQPVAVTDQHDITVLVTLLGDNQAEVRQYISEFLMKLSDAATVEKFREAFMAIPHQDFEKTGDAVYNAVVILSTWERVLPPDLGVFKQTVKNDLASLESQLSGNQWEKTRQLIQQINRLNKQHE